MESGNRLRDFHTRVVQIAILAQQPVQFFFQFRFAIVKKLFMKFFGQNFRIAQAFRQQRQRVAVHGFDYGDADSCADDFNGMMVKDISAVGDSIIMGWYAGSSHVFDDCKINGLNTVADLINNSFEGAMDTLDPGFATKISTTGTKRLIDVQYLHSNPNIQPTIIPALRNPIAQVPDVYTLYQNYPNPFNPTTTISFDLPEQAFVTLKIYNTLGQEVGTLLNAEQMDEGTQEVQFNAGNLASGVYFYRISAQGIDDDGVLTNTFSTVMKMLLVK